MAPTPIHYGELVEQIQAMVDEFGGMKSRISRAFVPESGLKAARQTVTSFLDDVHEDLSEVLTQAIEAAAVYGPAEVAKSESKGKQSVDDLVAAAVAKALGQPAAESTEGESEEESEATEDEPAEPAAEPTAEAPKGRGRRSRQPIPA